MIAIAAKGLGALAENILSYLDHRSLCAAELVCREWRQVGFFSFYFSICENVYVYFSDSKKYVFLNKFMLRVVFLLLGSGRRNALETFNRTESPYKQSLARFERKKRVVSFDFCVL